MLQAVGPQEWFYKELQTVEEASFRWKEQVQNIRILKSCHVPIKKFWQNGKLFGISRLAE